jgi:hypothetical protein
MRRDGGMREKDGWSVCGQSEKKETTRRSLYDYVTRLSIEFLNTISTSRRLTPSPSNSHIPLASLHRYAKSA